ncbi:4'-phosphopantetheinyl transferase superfamily protein [Sphingobacterium sp. DR205]|uniref:4'-phosphopantetheinyl transferase family protein n=1 Tax=Sphingobacterium sp. DR205 TaxID=2713573 RepID=UPI0013E465BA|nr:4'-phosphopantetheinyl transferase superfamily protein [Sphingobacterium sp. DR205]QIH33427.1 4'-phosphopantetheinyl transferase superfamily protein [Sphingobacterium sp. DR205]
MRSNVDIFYCWVEKRLPKASFEELLKTLPIGVVNRIQRFHRWEDAYSCLIGYKLIESYVLRGHQSWAAFQTNPYGKPYLKDGPFFNTTHSGSLVVLSVANFEIGIDVELIKEYDYKSLLSEVASPVEKQRIFNSSDPLTAFYNYWTQKEACIKQIGKGLSISLKSFEITEENAACIEARKLKLLNVKISAKDYVLNLAVPYDLFNNSIEFVINTNSINMCELLKI